MKYTLNIDKRFNKAIKEFMKKHEDCEREVTGEKFSYTFQPDNYGIEITVRCESCGDELHLMEYYDREMVGDIEESDTVIFSDDSENREGVSFTIDDSKSEEFKEFFQEHSKCRASSTGGRYAYTFIPSYYSMRILIECCCEDVLDIMEYNEPFTESQYIND
ncbi:hypothetical protein B5E87_14520 [Massilimicrobiota sp. An142]|uniref:hypothetical protein n=1 Tax=unclassified Massilimicrobiota TaxID=2619866 RepID=UPI000B379BD2|nr:MULTISPECIES: hypothetical protein [unclassified Massilimicrobiota]OUN31472.1 hypothetical protein B5G32_12625 [Massilimicrobiota sp. An80]OUQ08568.1 hypothetical protein B5E87_14520 [Massilimicrobiota sp. An142]OUQ74217.1 hypothetical protein B5E48_13215 [Massilimicrobiota sp. An105]